MSEAIRAVLFDRDDTLSHTDTGVYAQAAGWAAQRYNLDAREVGRAMKAQWDKVDQLPLGSGGWWDMRTHEEEAAFWTRYGAELAGRLGLDAAEGPALVEAYPYWRYLVPASGALELLRELRARGLKIGVLSNTLPSVATTLEALGMDQLVDVALSSCALGVHKPDPQVFLLAAERLGVAPTEVLFVDDLPENVAGARSVGMQALQIDHRGLTEGAIHTLDAVLEHLNGVGA